MEKIRAEVAQGQGCKIFLALMPCPAIDILVPMEAVLLIYGLIQRQKFDLLDILADWSPVTCFVCKPKLAEAEKTEASLNIKNF